MTSDKQTTPTINGLRLVSPEEAGKSDKGKSGVSLKAVILLDGNPKWAIKKAQHKPYSGEFSLTCLLVEEIQIESGENLCTRNAGDGCEIVNAKEAVQGLRRDDFATVRGAKVTVEKLLERQINNQKKL